MQKIVKNRKIFLSYTFFDALAQTFASWHSITLQNIWALLQSWICQNFAILGQNSQILCTNREKLGIIFSIYICWCIGTNVCNMVLGNLTKHISDATKLNLPKSFSIFGQNSQILSKCHEKLENILVPIFCTVKDHYISLWYNLWN